MQLFIQDEIRIGGKSGLSCNIFLTPPVVTGVSLPGWVLLSPVVPVFRRRLCKVLAQRDFVPKDKCLPAGRQIVLRTTASSRAEKSRDMLN